MRISLTDHERLQQSAEIILKSAVSARPILSFLVSCGFSRARFYEILDNRAENEKTLVLTMSEPEEPELISTRVRVNQSDYLSAIGEEAASGRRATVFDASGFTRENIPRWIGDLGLSDRCWIDIPLYASNTQVGLIACDWDGTKDDVREEDLAILDLIGAAFAAHRFLALSEPLFSATVMEVAPSELSSVFAPMLKDLCKSADAAIAAVFEYHWDTYSLEKVWEEAHPDCSAKPEWFPESYEVGEHLSGRAWETKEDRYIHDFEELINAYPLYAEPESLDRHRKILGEVRTVLYDVIGRSEPRFMVRLMNRYDAPELPILTPLESVRRIKEQFETEIEERLIRERLRVLQQLALAAVISDESPKQVLDLLRAALINERARSFALLAHSSGYGSDVSYRLLSGPHFESVSPKSGLTRSEDRLLGALKRQEIHEPTIMRISNLVRSKSDSPIAAALIAANVNAFAAFNFSSGSTDGFLLVPLSGGSLPAHGTLAEKSMRLSSASIEMLSALAAIAGGAIEKAFAFPSVEGARRFVALAGHEITSPAASIQQTALEALRLSKKLVSPNSPYYREIKQLESDLKEDTRDFQRLVGLAALVSQSGSGQLEFHFKYVDLYPIMWSAALTVRSEQVKILAQEREIYFAFDEGAKKIGPISCDSILLRQAFMNLFRNAAKYSFPREAREPVVVKISGSVSRGTAILRISNFGIGIPDERLEAIFEPFVRGGVSDTRRAIRGMGLGLYMTRLIVEGHEGSVRCLSSRPIWSDPRRLAVFEGFETTFEVRLPRGEMRSGTEKIDVHAMRRSD